MSQPFDLRSLFTQFPPQTKRKIFASYHHQGDQQYYNAFTTTFDDTYDIIFDNSMERRVDSDNVNYVLQRIRDTFISGTSCTIVLCGLETPWRKYVDWEIKATLDMEHGLIGVNLPTNRASASGNVIVPDRLHHNIQSGYAVWTNWTAFTQSAAAVKSLIEQAVNRSPKQIVNDHPMMARNGTPPRRM